MQIKKHKFFSHKLSLLAPVFALFVSITSIFALILLTSNNSTFAAPGAGGTPVTTSISVSSPTVNIQFNQADILGSRAQESVLIVTSTTNNITGGVTYISSIDENTSLKHTDSSVTDEIASITSQLSLGAFPAKSWGYRKVNNPNYSPIPKVSAPDTIISHQEAYGDTSFILFGAKPSSDLPAGTYSKQIVFTTITNVVPKTATFKPGREIKDVLRSINPAHDTNIFKRSTTAPANLGNATIVSTVDSIYPIYVWYNSPDKTIYWWSEADDVYANEDASVMFGYINYPATNTVSLIDTRGINFSKTTNMSSMFNPGNGIYNEINIDGMDTSNVEDMAYMFVSGSNANVVTAPIDISHLNTSKVKNMGSMFQGSLASMINMSGIDTGNVEDMTYIFQDAKKVTSLNLANLNVTKVRNTMQLFFGMSSLKHLDLSNWNLASLTSLDYFLRYTPSLESVNFTGFKTDHITSMQQMFLGSGVKTLDLSSFNTSHVTNMEKMFMQTSRLTAVNLSSFNTSSVTNMKDMFSGASSITNLDLSSFNTSNVTDMSYMFSFMSALRDLKVNTFDTRNVTNMTSMFSGAMTDLGNGTLDLSSFNSQSLVDTGGMFANTKVKTIYTSPQFSLDSVTNSLGMFWDNTNLVGGNGTAYSNGFPQDKTYARIDAPGTPGYFTLKP